MYVLCGLLRAVYIYMCVCVKTKNSLSLLIRDNYHRICKQQYNRHENVSKVVLLQYYYDKSRNYNLQY